MPSSDGMPTSDSGEVPAWQDAWDRALGELTDDQLLAADAARKAALGLVNKSVDDELVNLVDVLRTAQDRIAALAVRTGGLGFTVQYNAGALIGSAITSLRSLLPPDRR